MKRTNKDPGSSDGGECKVKRVPPKGPGQPAFDITPEMLLPLVNQGLTKAQMAQELHVSESTVQRKLSDFKISLRQRGSSNRKGSDDTRMHSAVRLRTRQGVQNTTELDHVASQLTATSETQSGQSTTTSTEMAAGSSFSPTEANTRRQEQGPKTRRVTAAMFQGNLPKDVTVYEYPDIDLQSDSTVEKGLVPDVSPPSSSLVLANFIQNAGDAKEHVILPSSVRFEAGGGQVAECDFGAGYDVGQAVGFRSKAAFSEKIRNTTESMGVLDEALNEIVLEYPLHEPIPQVQALVGKQNSGSLSPTEMLLDSLAFLPNPETVKEKVKPADSEVEMRKKEACSNAAAPATIPFGLSDDSKPVALSILSDDSGLQHRAVAHPGNSQLQKQGDPFLWQPEQDGDVTRTEFSQLPLNFSQQETVGPVSWNDADIREVEQVPEQPEFEQKDHTQSWDSCMGPFDLQDLGLDVAFSGVTGNDSPLTSRPPQQGDWQAVAGQNRGEIETVFIGATGHAFLEISRPPGQEDKREMVGQSQEEIEMASSGMTGHASLTEQPLELDRQDLDFPGLDELTAMIEFDQMQGRGVLGMEGVPQILGSGQGPVDQQMLGPGGVQTDAEDAEGAAGQPVRQGLALREFCDQFLNYATQNGVEGGNGGNVPRFDMI